MADDKSYTCSKCGASFEGSEASKQASDHKDSFHPAGSPRDVARAVPPGTSIVEGKDFGPAVSDLATELGDVKGDVGDLAERVKALEEGQRSSIDLEALVEQIVPQLQSRVANITINNPEPSAAPTSTEEVSYGDLQARAKALGIPATGSRDALEAAIAAEDAKTSAGT